MVPTRQLFFYAMSSESPYHMTWHAVSDYKEDLKRIYMSKRSYRRQLFLPRWKQKYLYIKHKAMHAGFYHCCQNYCIKFYEELTLFQVINHGIPLSIMKDALDAATEFFNLPIEEKMLLVSDNVHEPVRYGTSVNHTRDKVYYWRDFIKHYSHPIAKWIHLWPSNPPNYK